MRTQKEPEFHIGCSGWLYKDWKGVFYPQDLPVKDYFSYYAKHFKTVEINSTFYRFPSQKTVQLWYQQAPQEFRYSIKASRFITHLKRFKQVQDSLRRLYELSDTLAEKMGCFLFQFPENFKCTEENLERILSQLDPSHKNVVEFRHGSWWSPPVLQALESAQIVFCTVSGFGLPNKLLTMNNQAYIRFHGEPAYSSLYSDKDLSYWAHNIAAASLKSLWVYFNNDLNAYAVQNAIQLKNLLSRQ